MEVEELAQFQHYIRFVSVDPSRNRARFYRLSWQRTLDGSAALICNWVRLGTSGQTRTIFVADQHEVHAKLTRLIKRRLRRGYDVREWQ